MSFHLTATGRHLPYGITQCYLLPDTSERAPSLTQPVSWYSIYLITFRGGMEGWVDLGYPAVHRPGVEPAIFRSLVRRPNYYTTEPGTNVSSFPCICMSVGGYLKNLWTDFLTEIILEGWDVAEGRID